MLNQLALAFGLAVTVASASSFGPPSAADNLRMTLERRRHQRLERRAGPSTTPVVASTLLPFSSYVLCPKVTGEKFFYSGSLSLSSSLADMAQYVEPADTVALPFLYCQCVVDLAASLG